MPSLENLAPYLKHLRGFLPVNKPKGVCSIKTLYALRLDADFIIKQNGLAAKSLEVYCARQLDPFASGLVTFVFNQANIRRRNFIQADYKYRAKIEFGVDREYNCIDGKILRRSSAHHLSADLINSALTLFHGKKEQTFNNSYKYKMAFDVMREKSLSEVDLMYNLIEMPSTYVKPESNQKYPYTKPSRNVECFSVELLEFDNPFAIIELHCMGGLNVRQLAVDLGEKLGTTASLVELIRTQEGPIALDDLRVIPYHELSLERYLHKMPIYEHIYGRYIAQFDTFFDNEPSYRPRM